MIIALLRPLSFQRSHESAQWPAKAEAAPQKEPAKLWSSTDRAKLACVVSMRGTADVAGVLGMLGVVDMVGVVGVVGMLGVVGMESMVSLVSLVSTVQERELWGALPCAALPSGGAVR